MFPLARRPKTDFLARMLFRRLLAVFLVTVSLAAVAAERKSPSRPAAPAKESSAGYKGAIVLDAATGNVLFEDRADTISPPASMTKLMTFAVVHDALAKGVIRLDTPVRVTVEDSKKGGTQVFLDPRETFPVEELIYAMMIQSANDASNALARATAGSASAFVELMNAKAGELSMTNTTFRTPHGLPPDNRKVAEGDLTTPRDFAKLAAYLLAKTDVLKYASVRTRRFGEGTRPEPMVMTNHNHLLGKVAGVDGLKTGFTNGAGFCISATAQRNGRRIIVVTMGSPQNKVRDLKVSELIERGFAALPPAPRATTPAAAAASPAASTTSTTAKPATAAAAAAGPAPEEASPFRPAPLPAKPAPAAEPVIKFSVPKR